MALMVDASGAATAERPRSLATFALARDVVDGLRRQPKQIPARYLYDALGSQLFEAICELPWYPITRGECVLLARERDAILQRLDTPATLVELGGGNGEKVAILAEGLARAGRAADVHLIDISETALDRALERVARCGTVKVHGHRAEYAAGLRAATARLEPNRSAMVLFLGSNIGNLHPGEADRFLAEIRDGLRPGDSFSAGRRPGEAAGGSHRRLRRSARCHRGVQPQPAGPPEPRAGRRLRCRAVRPPGGMERQTGASRVVPGEPGGSDGLPPGGRLLRPAGRGREYLDRKFVPSTSRTRSRTWESGPVS